MPYYLYKTCDTCNGDGVVDNTYPPGTGTCWQCDGTGTYQVYSVGTDLSSTIETIFDKTKDTNKQVKDMAKIVDNIWAKLNE